MQIITWPEHIPASKVRKFWQDAGYRENKDFRIGNTEKGKLFIRPLTQMILAQDALSFGFKKESLD